MFRALHTIKGGASFLEVGHLVEWTHDLESLLDKLRSGKLAVTSLRIDAILQGLDVMGQMLKELAQEQVPPAGPGELGSLIQSLSRQESDEVHASAGPAAKDRCDTLPRSRSRQRDAPWPRLRFRTTALTRQKQLGTATTRMRKNPRQRTRQTIVPCPQRHPWLRHSVELRRWRTPADRRAAS